LLSNKIIYEVQELTTNQKKQDLLKKNSGEMPNRTSSILQKDELVMRANHKILYVKVYQQGVRVIPAKV
jgi:hypothetical protein